MQRDEEDRHDDTNRRVNAKHLKMGSILISRNDRSLTGQDLLSMNMECRHFFSSYKQVDLHSDSLGPLMHTLF